MPLSYAAWAELSLCLIVICVTARTLFRQRGRSIAASYVLCMLNMMFFDALVRFPISWTPGILPIVYDPVLYRLSAIIHLADIRPIAGLANSSPMFQAILSFSYISLTHLVSLGFSSEIAYQKVEIKRSLFARFVLLGFIGYGLYFLMPAVSPGVYFGANFPDRMPSAADVAKHAVPLNHSFLWATRNTMPSLHAAWAVQCFFALWKSPVWHRLLGFVFVIFTFLATIGFGYHYAIDWVAAFPLVLLVRGLTANLPARGIRAAAVAAGAVLLALWVAAVRITPQALDFPDFIEFLAALSISVPVVFEVILRRQEYPADSRILVLKADQPNQISTA